MVVDVAAAAAELVAGGDDDVDVEDGYVDGVAGTAAALVVAAAAVVGDLDSSCWSAGGRVLEAYSARDTEVSC